MIRFVKYELESGRIVLAGTCREADLSLQGEIGFAVAVHDSATPLTHKVVDGTPVEYTGAGKLRLAAPPGAGYRWDPAAEDWVDERAIEEVRARVLARLRTKRDALLEGGFVWDGSTFDSDTAVSQPRLLGLFTTAIAGGMPPSGYQWRLKDNSWRTLSAADAQGVWAALQGHMAALFAAFAAHEAAVLPETDINVLRNYNVDAGWPT